MSAAAVADRFDFFPPAEHRTPRAYLLALIAHALLLAALTWGVNWKTQQQTATVEAELWSNVVQEAAPKLVEPPPPPPPPPPQPQPKPVPQPVAAKPEPVAPDPQIAIEKERKRLEKLEREEQKKAELAEKKRIEQEKKEQERLEREEKKRLEAIEKERQRQEAEAKEKARQDAIKAAERAAEKDAYLRRMTGQAGATGSPTSIGTALRSSGPSAGYGAKIVALLRPKIVFPDISAGNPQAEVEVRTAPDGSVVSRRLTRSSGVPAWDDAVLKAIDKTDRFPPDTDGDGKVPSPITLTFRPKDF